VSGKNAPRTLGLLDITIDRNAYGTQADSFETSLRMKGTTKRVQAAFIRAPKILSVGRSVEVLAEEEKYPVIVRQGRIIAATCHPEMRGEKKVHELFLTL
jgi:5'-phosphate synthase pdxT subunit